MTSVKRPCFRAGVLHFGEIPPVRVQRVRAFSFGGTMTTQLVALALVVAGTALSQSTQQSFQAAAVTRTGHLEFDGAIDKVFYMFTPIGERNWAKGWDPEVLFPLDREVAEGMVFITRDQDGRVLTWTMTRYDAANHTVAYNVVTPDFVVRKLQIRCRLSGAARIEVEVTDSYVGLSAQGNEFVEHLTEHSYASKMATWKEGIDGYLAGIAKAAR